MDPLTLGVSVGLALISSLGKKLTQKASDPEAVAAGIHWLFSAVENFVQIRKKQRPPDTPIAPPPAQESPAPVSAAASPDLEKEMSGAGEVPGSTGQPGSSNAGELRVLALNEFALAQLDREIASLLKQIETYVGTLNFEEEKAAQYGGITFAPPIVMNTIRIQQEEIARRIVRLNQCMQKAYGASAPDLDVLVEASQSSTSS